MADLTSFVNNNLISRLTCFCRDQADKVKTCVLTGSFARGTHDRHDPNLNIYFFAHVGQSSRLRFSLATEMHSIQQSFRNRNIAFRVDCHPYLVMGRNKLRSGAGSITLTTKVFDVELAHMRFSLPPTIGAAWLADFNVLFGDSCLLKQLKQTPAAPAEWLASFHEALSRYRGVIDHLPFIPDRNAVAAESIFYAREVLRDLVAIASPFETLNRGGHFIWLNEKREADLFRALEWNDVVSIGAEVASYCKRLQTSHNLSQLEVQHAWELAIRTWSIGWEKYLERARATLGSDMPWLNRVNAFI